MQQRDPVAEPGTEASDGLRREPDLGHEDDRPALLVKRVLDRHEVDLGLPRARDAMQQQLMLGSVLAVESGRDLSDRGLLVGIQVRPLR